MRKKMLLLTNLTLNILLYIGTFVTPKNNTLLLFSGRDGESYAGNSKALFEYLNENQENLNLQLYWITSNKKVYEQLKKLHYIRQVVFDFFSPAHF